MTFIGEESAETENDKINTTFAENNRCLLGFQFITSITTTGLPQLSIGFGMYNWLPGSAFDVQQITGIICAGEKNSTSDITVSCVPFLLWKENEMSYMIKLG